MPKIGHAHFQCTSTTAAGWKASEIRMAFIFLNGLKKNESNCMWPTK